MGLLDLSVPDASEVIGQARESRAAVGLLGVGAGVAAGTLITPSAPLTSVLVPTIAQAYIWRGSEQIAAGTKDLADLIDGSDSDRKRDACLLRLCSGLAMALEPLIPDGQVPQQSDQPLAAEDTEKFLEAIERIAETDPDKLQEIEDRLQQVLAAKPEESATDPDEVLEKIQETFDVNSEQEAVQILHLCREFLDDIHQTIDEETENAPNGEVQETLTALERRIDYIRDGIDQIVDTILTIELEDGQGFTQLSVDYFKKRDPYHDGESPLKSWIWGIEFSHLSARTANGEPYQFDLQASADDPPFHRTIINDLSSGQGGVLITAGPECGKSTVTKRVAYEWVDQDRGVVFYRESEGGTQFDGPRALETAIERDRVQGVGGGCPLVVVEDVFRQDDTILEAIDTLTRRNDIDIAFLLDARSREWDEFESRRNEYIDLFRADGSGPISVQSLPELSEQTCANAIAAFERIEGVEYPRTASELYEEVSELCPNSEPDDEPAYVITTLIKRLLTRGSVSSDVISGPWDGQELLRKFMRSEELFHEFVAQADLNDPEARQRARLAVAINLLNASELKLTPERLLTVAWADQRIDDDISEPRRQDFEQIEDLLTRSYSDEERLAGLNGIIIRVPSSPPRFPDRAIATRPPSWSEDFLEAGMESDSRRTLQQLAAEALGAILEVLGPTASDKRKRVQKLLHRSSLIEGDSFEVFQSSSAETVAERIYDWADQTVAHGDRVFNISNWRMRLLNFEYDPDIDVDDVEPVHQSLPDGCSPALQHRLRQYVIPTDTTESTIRTEFAHATDLIADDEALTPSTRHRLTTLVRAREITAYWDDCVSLDIYDWMILWPQWIYRLQRIPFDEIKVSDAAPTLNNLRRIAKYYFSTTPNERFGKSIETIGTVRELSPHRNELTDEFSDTRGIAHVTKLRAEWVAPERIRVSAKFALPFDTEQTKRIKTSPVTVDGVKEEEVTVVEHTDTDLIPVLELTEVTPQDAAVAVFVINELTSDALLPAKGTTYGGETLRGLISQLTVPSADMVTDISPPSIDELPPDFPEEAELKRTLDLEQLARFLPADDGSIASQSPGVSGDGSDTRQPSAQLLVLCVLFDIDPDTISDDTVSRIGSGS